MVPRCSSLAQLGEVAPREAAEEGRSGARSEINDSSGEGPRTVRKGEATREQPVHARSLPCAAEPFR